jgi:hypothetical protein
VHAFQHHVRFPEGLGRSRLGRAGERLAERGPLLRIVQQRHAFLAGRRVGRSGISGRREQAGRTI